MLAKIITAVIAVGSIYLYAMLISLFSKKIVDFKAKKLAENSIRSKAKELIENDIRVKKIYVYLRIMYLKNKHTPEVEILEQKLRTLVREKAIREEILHMVRAKVIMR